VVLPPHPSSAATAVYHLFVIRVQARDTLRTHLTAAGISTGIHYPVPLHLQPAYVHLGYGPGSFPGAEGAAREVLSLPIYPEMTESQLSRVVAALKCSLQTLPPQG